MTSSFSYTMPTLADELRVKGVGYYPTQSNSVGLDLLVGKSDSDDIHHMYSKGGIDTSKQRVKEAFLSTQRFLYPKFRVAKSGNTAPQPFASSSNQAGKFGYSGGAFGAMTTTSSRMTPEQWESHRLEVLKRRISGYTAMREGVVPPPLPLSSFQDNSAKKLQMDLLISQLEERVYEDVYSPEVYRDLQNVINNMIVVIADFNDVNTLAQYVARLKALQQDIDETRLDENEDEDNTVATSRDLSGLKAVRLSLDRLIKYIENNVKGVGNNDIIRRRLASDTSLLKISHKRRENLMRAMDENEEVGENLDQQPPQEPPLQEVPEQIEGEDGGEDDGEDGGEDGDEYPDDFEPPEAQPAQVEAINQLTPEEQAELADLIASRTTPPTKAQIVLWLSSNKDAKKQIREARRNKLYLNHNAEQLYDFIKANVPKNIYNPRQPNQTKYKFKQALEKKGFGRKTGGFDFRQLDPIWHINNKLNGRGRKTGGFDFRLLDPIWHIDKAINGRGGNSSSEGLHQNKYRQKLAELEERNYNMGSSSEKLARGGYMKDLINAKGGIIPPHMRGQNPQAMTPALRALMNGRGGAKGGYSPAQFKWDLQRYGFIPLGF